METAFSQRIFANTLGHYINKEVLLRGWVYRLRVLAKTTFVMLHDCSGEVQCVAASEELKALQLKLRIRWKFTVESGQTRDRMGL